MKTGGLAVDIDETLSWTIGHWTKQMQKEFGNPEKLSVKSLIKKYNYAQNVPYWQSKEALKFMDKLRNSNEIQEFLPLIKGSPFFLNKINEIIPITVYLTTRPEKVIGGTEKWLKKHKFPEARIICRPERIPTTEGNKWKARILKRKFPKINGIIDDHPNLIKYLEPGYKGTVFLYNHKPVKSRIKVVSCKNWREVYSKVKKVYGMPN